MSYDVLGQTVRSQRAAKVHQCSLGNHDIAPGEVYLIGVTFPGEGGYQSAPGEWESIDWPFTVLKSCVPCHDREMVGE